jgi:hypothetical protein
LAEQPIPCPTLLRLLLRYDPSAGKLYWNERPRWWFKSQREHKRWNGRYAGQVAFETLDTPGYYQGSVRKRLFKAHRVIWAIVHGVWPEAFIDHINGNRLDNRLENLRVVSKTENARNQKRRYDNISGAPGVTWCKRTRRWRAKIGVNGRQRQLGSFTAVDEAIKARREAERNFGFHENHGRR